MKKVISGTFLTLALVSVSLGQSLNITGYVCDIETKKALEGANVVVKGTKIGAATDMDGRYRISGLPPGEYEIVVGMMGYESETKWVKVSEGTTTLDFALRQKIKAYELEPVTVTATKRKQSLADLASSVVVHDRKTLRSAGAIDIADVAYMTPNMFFEHTGHGHVHANIRGVGTSSYRDPAVSIFVDGIYIPGFNSGTFTDIERVEVLRGPQGTLYGSSSHAGVINIITHQPIDFFESEASLSYGNYETYLARVVLNVPIVKNKLSFRQGALYHKSNGYMKNTTIGVDDGDNVDDFINLSKLLWKLDTKSRLALAIYGRRARNGYDRMSTLEQMKTDPFTTTPSHSGFIHMDIFGSSLCYEKEFTNVTLTSATAYSNSHSDALGWADFIMTPLNWMSHGSHYITVSEEIRLALRKTKNVRFEGLAGLFIQRQKLERDFHRDYTMPGPTHATMSPKTILETDSYAAFGEITHHTTKNLDLTFGGRYDVQKRENDWSKIQTMGDFPAMEESTTASKDFAEFLPKAVVTWKWSPILKNYFSIVRGYKVGGYNITASSKQEAETPYDSELFWNYELGLKGYTKNRRLSYGLCLFYIDLKNQQVSTWDENMILSYQNAGESYSKGAEAEFKVYPFQGTDLQIFTAASVAETKFEKFSDLQGYDLTGLRFPLTPENQWVFGAQHRFSLGFMWRLEILGVGNYVLDDRNEMKQEAYKLLNARVGYEPKSWWSISAWGKNLLDEHYKMEGVGPSAMMGNNFLVQGPPLTFGTEVKVKF